MNRLNRQRARDAIRLAAAIRGCTCRRDIVHEPRRALIATSRHATTTIARQRIPDPS